MSPTTAQYDAQMARAARRQDSQPADRGQESWPPERGMAAAQGWAPHPSVVQLLVDYALAKRYIVLDPHLAAEALAEVMMHRVHDRSVGWRGDNPSSVVPAWLYYAADYVVGSAHRGLSGNDWWQHSYDRELPRVLYAEHDPLEVEPPRTVTQAARAAWRAVSR